MCDDVSFGGTGCLHFIEEVFFYSEDGGSKMLVAIY
jgi:hypothetical protein